METNLATISFFSPHFSQIPAADAHFGQVSLYACFTVFIAHLVLEKQEKINTDSRSVAC